MGRLLATVDRFLTVLQEMRELIMSGESSTETADDNGYVKRAVCDLARFLFRIRHEFLESIRETLSQRQRAAVMKIRVAVGNTAQLLKKMGGVSLWAPYLSDMGREIVVLLDVVQLNGWEEVLGVSMSASIDAF